MNASEEDCEGKAIASEMGDALTGSGALDDLVEKGKEPDSGCVYIYNHDQAWRKGVPFMDSARKVKPGRRVHKVRRGERGVGYEFEFVDEPGKVVYTVNYGWALVVDTPENERMLEYVRKSRERIREEQKWLAGLVKDISLSDS